MSTISFSDLDTYSDLLEIIGEKKIRDRVNELIDTARNLIKEMELEEYAECSERIMLQVVLDYFSDIIRLKDFHGIEHVRQEKITAYQIAWIIKRKPIQFIKEVDTQSDININERLAGILYMNDLLKSGELYVSGEDIEKFNYFLDLFFYYLKYRECNPQVLELSIEAFKMGTLTKKS